MSEPLPTRVLVAITLVLALVFACITSPHYLFGTDSARYVALARSLVEGDGYFRFGQPERHYPPGFPLLLTPAALIKGESFATIARWAAIIGALVFPAVYAFGRTRTAALPIALLTIGSAGFLDIIAGNPRSEPIYMVCTLGLIAWAHRGATQAESSRGRTGFVAMGTVLLLMSVATRSIGLAAVGAVTMVLLERILRPDGRIAPSRAGLILPLAAGVTFLVAWFAWTRWAPNPGGEGTYVGDLLLRDPHHPELGPITPVALVSRLARNLLAQLSHIAELLTQLPWLKPRWFSPFVAGAMALTAAGLWAEMRRPSRVGAWYVLGYAAILLLWPYDEGTRFLVPILPFLWLFAIVGARRATAALQEGSRPFRLGMIAAGSLSLLVAGVTFGSDPGDFSRQDQAFAALWALIVAIVVFAWAPAGRLVETMSRRAGRPLVAGALALYAAVGVARTVPVVMAQYRGNIPENPVAEALREASAWIGSQTPSRATVLATLPAPVEFASGRRTVKFPSTSSPEQLRMAVETHRPDYLVVLHDSDHPYYLPVDSEKLTIVQSLFPGAVREVVRLRGSSIYAFR